MGKLKFKIACLLFALLYFFSSTAVPAFAAITYLYDQNGNTTSDGTKCYAYNESNKLVRVRTCSNNQLIAEYVYDYEGNRLVKKEYENGILKRTIYSPSDEYETAKIASTGVTQNTTYYKANDQLIAKKNPDGTKNYYHNDHLGSTSIMTSQTGTLVEETRYDPWGEVKTGGTKSKFLYTGQEKDLETGLNYYGARYYDPHTRRFTQPDDYIQDIYHPQSLNRYSYVNNNPLKYTDPTGHFGWLINFVQSVASILARAGSSIISTASRVPATNPSTQKVVQKTSEAVQKTTSNPVVGKVVDTASKVTNNSAVNKGISNAGTILQQIRDNHGKPLEGFHSGIYRNVTKPYLPQVEEVGRYMEHDIKPLVEGINRGTKRLVIDTLTGKAWYTPDHYKSWIPFDK